MLERMNCSKLTRVMVSCLLILCFSWGLTSCRDRVQGTEITNQVQIKPSERITEVAPPPVLQELRQKLEKYQPQVKILSPQRDQLFSDTKVKVQLELQDLPIFKNETLGMGPHLHLIVDNQPYQAIYDISKPITLEDLEPGTHTLRVFASRPWHESFKNEGAYAQTTFHLFTKTNKNNPDPNLPLLTYSRPKGEYFAEPIMLDFYLTNAPLHLVAQESLKDQINDWRVQVTVNSQSFTLENWQPIYLKGFKKGINWVQLAFLDEQGQEIENDFNNTVRLINYQPGKEDTLSKLVQGKLSAEAALGIVNPTVTTIPTEVEVTEKATPVEPEREETPVQEEVKTILQPEVTEETGLPVIEPFHPESEQQEIYPKKERTPTKKVEKSKTSQPKPAEKEPVIPPTEIFEPGSKTFNSDLPPTLPEIIEDVPKVKSELQQEVEKKVLPEPKLENEIVE